jgi:hypothetical protein
MEKTEFKVGDWVIRKDGKVLKLYPKEQASKGDFVDKTLSKDGTVYKLDVDIRDILRHATPEEIKKVQGYVLKETETSLKVEDLVRGKVYVINFENHPNWDSIFESNGEYNNSYRLYLNGIKGKEFDTSDGQWSIDYKFTIRKATQEEKDWLNVCIKANKFIPKEEALKTKEKEIKFEVGKWYKWEYKDLTIYYLKYSSTNGQWFTYSEFINTSIGVLTSSTSNVIEKEVGEEIPLSEIQQYLPEGHIDKKKVKFISKEGTNAAYDIGDILIDKMGCPYDEGTSISCYINGRFIKDGKIHYEEYKVFICQNIICGAMCKDLLGYKFSYCVVDTVYDYCDTWSKGLVGNRVSGIRNKLLDTIDDSVSPDVFSETIFIPEGYYNKDTTKSKVKRIEIYTESTPVVVVEQFIPIRKVNKVKIIKI